ncbi:MAG: acetylornithine deacetylase [Chromatiales bacterium]|nr:MAG: acetylornithine deacetylase [Chromatiales bacterium]
MPTAEQALLKDIRELIARPSISSVSPDWDQSNERVIEFLAERFSSRGFRVDVQPLDTPGKSNLVATLGAGEGGLVLSGHTDTVPCDPGLWHSDPFEVQERGQKLYGLGTADMKSFFALVLAATDGLRAEQLKHPLVVLATADEESSMRGARALARAGAPLGRHAVIGEPTSLRPVRLHKGILMERIRVIGRSGHSSNPALGNNALEGMHAVIAALLTWRSDLEGRAQDPDFEVPVTTMNLGRISGGDNPNRICGQCELDVDLRMLPGMQCAPLRTELRELVAEVLRGIGLDSAFDALFEGVDPMTTPAVAPIVKATEALTGAPAGAVAYGTEAPYLTQLGMDVVVLGPGAIDQAHQPDEYLALDGIEPGVEILRALIRQFCLQAD